MSIASKKLAVAAIAGLMAVGFASTASATANPYPQGYLGNGTAVEKNACNAKTSCNAVASCNGQKDVGAKKHHRHHAKKAPAATAPAAAMKPAAKAPAAKPVK